MFPIDCVIFQIKYNSSQYIAKFRAGRIQKIPAKTGNDNNNNTAVITIAQPNNANLCKRIPGLLIFNIVVIKFIAPSILLIPLKCKLNIAKSTLGPL